MERNIRIIVSIIIGLPLLIIGLYISFISELGILLIPGVILGTIGVFTMLFTISASLGGSVYDKFVDDFGTSKQIRNCVKCGRSIPWDANLCPYCGHNYN